MATAVRSEGNETRQIIAYRIHDIAVGRFPRLVCASPDRTWMDEQTKGWANRCLPLRIANQAGWFILNDEEFVAAWDGSNDTKGVQVVTKGAKPPYVHSMFGVGTLTWVVPFLFRTPPGVNLLVRGPSNMVKDGIAPLDGVVESDWLSAPFTMNWKFTRSFKKVKFERGEPIAMILPIRRGEMESFEPEMRNIESEPALHQEFRTWWAKRLEKVNEDPSSDTKNKIQGHYIRGESVTGTKAPEHQNRLELREFTELEAALLKEPPRSETPTAPKSRGFLSRLIGR